METKLKDYYGMNLLGPAAIKLLTDATTALKQDKEAALPEVLFL